LRSRHSNYTGASSTFSWGPYLTWRTWKALVQVILSLKRTSAQSQSPTLFLCCRVPTTTTHATIPWFQGMAQRTSDYSKPNWKDKQIGRSSFYIWLLSTFFKNRKEQLFKVPFRGACSEKKISRCRRTIHMEIVRHVAEVHIYLDTWTYLTQVILTSTQTAKQHDLTIFHSLDLLASRKNRKLSYDAGR
jgi:hypothetical protein